MNSEKSGSSDYVLYVTHTSSSAASPYVASTAAPASLATMMRNNTLITSLEVVPVVESGADDESSP